MGSAMAKGKLKKNSKDTAVGAKGRQKEMTQPEKHHNVMFPLAAIALVVAVCVVPLSAEISTCKYPGLFTKWELIARRSVLLS